MAYAVTISHVDEQVSTHMSPSDSHEHVHFNQIRLSKVMGLVTQSSGAQCFVNTARD